jgi:hypothetical protein
MNDFWGVFTVTTCFSLNMGINQAYERKDEINITQQNASEATYLIQRMLLT